MSGFIDIDGSTMMCGSPGVEDLAEGQLLRRTMDEQYGPSPLRRLAKLSSDVPAVQAVFDRAAIALRHVEAGDWDGAVIAFNGPMTRHRRAT